MPYLSQPHVQTSPILIDEDHADSLQGGVGLRSCNFIFHKIHHCIFHEKQHGLWKLTIDRTARMEPAWEQIMRNKAAGNASILLYIVGISEFSRNPTPR